MERDSKGVYRREIPASAFDVKAVANYYFTSNSGFPKVDLAVLNTLDFSHDHWVTLDLTGTIDHGDVIDILGYPGPINEGGILVSHSSITNANLDKAVDNARQLLPSGTLVVTFGTIIDAGDLPTFRASTTHGLSGAPVVHNGKVIGNFH